MPGMAVLATACYMLCYLTFFMKIARAPPRPVTIIGIAAALIESSTQLLRTSLVFHLGPIRIIEVKQAMRRAVSGSPIKENTLAARVSFEICVEKSIKHY